MQPRLYLPPPVSTSPGEGSIVLDDGRSHYLVRVLRMKRDDAIEVFDGEGREWSARIDDANAKACRIELTASTGRRARSQPAVHLAQALIKGAAMDRLLQKATELGVDEIWLLTSEFAQVGWARANTRMTHWHKILVRAAEQSRRAYLPKLHPAVPVEQFLRTETTSTLILLQPGSPPLPRDLVAQETTLIVGPEGGWAPSELDAAASRGIALHGLGNLTLRAETAPMVALAAIQHAWGWP